MEYAILGIVALVIGLGIGWFVGSRPAAEWRARHAERDAEAKELSERLSRMAPELAAMSERAARADRSGAAHLHVIPDAGHWVHADAAGEISELLREEVPSPG